MAYDFDLFVIGAGSAGTRLSRIAAGHGARVGVAEDRYMGGTCVNVGCVPSKIMIRAAHVAQVRRTSPFDEGISVATPAVLRDRLRVQQQRRVDELRHAKYEGILESTPAITVLRGNARFTDARTLSVATAVGDLRDVNFDYCLVATGALPAIPSIPGLQDTPYWTSTEALVSASIPARVGGFRAFDRRSALAASGSIRRTRSSG